MLGKNHLLVIKGKCVINCSCVDSVVILKGEYFPEQLNSLQNEIFKLCLESSEEWRVDLGEVIGSGSGLVALLLSCMRLADEKDRKIVFFGLSPQLVGLIQLSNLESIIHSEQSEF